MQYFTSVMVSFKKAVNLGNSKTMLNSAFDFEHYYLSSKDLVRSMKWRKKAANLGNLTPFFFCAVDLEHSFLELKDILSSV